MPVQPANAANAPFILPKANTSALLVTTIVLSMLAIGLALSCITPQMRQIMVTNLTEGVPVWPLIAIVIIPTIFVLTTILLVRKKYNHALGGQQRNIDSKQAEIERLQQILLTAKQPVHYYLLERHLKPDQSNVPSQPLAIEEQKQNAPDFQEIHSDFDRPGFSDSNKSEEEEKPIAV